MTVAECYAALEADYQDVMSRLLTEERVIKYLRKVLTDENEQNMLTALEKKDYEAAFRYVHNMKGLCLNLGLSRLFACSSELCEALRNGEPAVDIQPMLQELLEEYGRTIEAIEKIDSLK